MKLSELTRSEAAYAGALEIYLPSGEASKLTQLPVANKSRKKLSTKFIKSIIAKEEEKRKNKGDSFFWKNKKVK